MAKIKDKAVKLICVIKDGIKKLTPELSHVDYNILTVDEQNDYSEICISETHACSPDFIDGKTYSQEEVELLHQYQPQDEDYYEWRTCSQRQFEREDVTRRFYIKRTQEPIIMGKKHHTIIGCNRVKERGSEKSHCVCGYANPEAKLCEHAIWALDERKSLNFTEFQVQLRSLLWIDSEGFDNEWMHDFFADFRSMQFHLLKEWAEFFFCEVTKDTHSYCLITKLGNKPKDTRQYYQLKPKATEEKPEAEKLYMRDYMLPKVITICGSTKFKAEYEAVNKWLTLRGHVVLSVACFGHADSHNFTIEDKKILDRVHRDKIDLSDAIFVIDKNGYIGESTKSEIAHAKLAGKKVYYMSQFT